MHETHIVHGMIEAAGKRLEEAGCRKIESITVKVGSASGVMPEALLFAFDAVKPGTAAEGAALIIEKVPLGGLCRACGKKFETEEPFILSCPACGGTELTIETGTELCLSEIEAS